jgi:transcription elongation GreA/GreB family factor
MTDRTIERATTGTWVKLTGFVPGEEEVFHLVTEREADVLENKIPPSSALAHVLDGAKAGDRVKFHPPAGEVELTILDVGRN